MALHAPADFTPAPSHTADAEISDAFTAREMSAAGGAQIRDVSLSDLTPSVLATTKRLFLKHKLLVFKDQQLSDDDILRFAQAFGPLEVNQVKSPDGGVLQAIHSIANFDAQGRPASSPLLKSNFNWHSDKSYLPKPSLMTMLYGLEVPPSGGDTEFSNMEMAYDELPQSMKDRLEGLIVTQSFEYMLDTLGQRAIIEEKDIPPPVKHPLVRTHPETGKKSLFVGMYACAIDGMPQGEARALIAELLAHATQEKYRFLQQWQANDFVCWDNRSLVHRAIPNYEMGKYRRVLRRCVVRGGVPA
ncbi:MAG: TauD/TfdA family dioxygenase [Pseudomonadota bacterium]